MSCTISSNIHCHYLVEPVAHLFHLSLLKGNHSCSTLNSGINVNRSCMYLEVVIKNNVSLQKYILFFSVSWITIWLSHSTCRAIKRNHGGVALTIPMYTNIVRMRRSSSRKWNMARRRTVFSVAPYFIVLICFSTVGLCAREGM